MSKLLDYINKLDTAADEQFYINLLKLYPEIELNKLEKFMQEIEINFNKICEFECTEPEYYFNIKNTFIYDSKDEGYWMIAFLKHTQFLFIVNKKDFTERMLTVLISFYCDYPYRCFRRIKLLSLLEAAPKDVVEKVLDDKNNLTNLIGYCVTETDIEDEMFSTTACNDIRLFRLLPPSIINNKDFWQPLIKFIPHYWTGREFRFLKELNSNKKVA